MGEPEAPRRELILYATPTGELAAQIKEFESRITAELGATTAQAYPPHVTLTGFFSRTNARADEVISDARWVIASLGNEARDDTSVVGLSVSSTWVGLNIVSLGFERLAGAIAARDRVAFGDDAIRLKNQLHLSLAYGELGPGQALAPYADRARDLIDHRALVKWDLAIWERGSTVGGSSRWTQH